MQSKQVDGNKMRQLGDLIKKNIPNGLGFCLLTFDFNSKSEANYIANANREDMIKFLRETADRFEKQQDYRTAEPGKMVKCISCGLELEEIKYKNSSCPSCGGIMLPK